MKNLELYVHIPFCFKKCAYCDFLSFSCDEKTQLAYADALIREIEYYGSQMKDYFVTTIFVGGGTPTWLNEDKMVEILDTIYTYFQVSDDAEITMECNPGTVTASKLEKYKRAGVNRLSIGLQSADDEELQILGRIHTFEKFVKTYEMAKCLSDSKINAAYITTATSMPVLEYIDKCLPDKDIALIGTDAPDGILQYMKKDILKGTIYQNQEKVGKVSVRTAYEYLVQKNSYGNEKVEAGKTIYIKPDLYMSANLE